MHSLMKHKSMQSSDDEHLMCITVEVNIKIIISRYNFIPIMINRQSGTTCFVLSQSY